jgi:hypothetical protein
MALRTPKAAAPTRQETAMLNPHTTKLIAGEHRRDLLASAQRQSLVQQFSAEPKSAQPITQRLRLSLRAVIRPRPAAHA